MNKRRYFSVEDEPALQAGETFAVDGAETTAAEPRRPPRELDAIRDSVRYEPHLADRADIPLPTFAAWCNERRRRATRLGDLGVTGLAALAGGPFAIVGAFLVGQQGLLAGLYVVLFGPVVEELLKQSGMVYVLEHKPYRIFCGGQFVAAAVASALLFATVENLIYIHVYVADAPGIDLAAFARFRWVVCTALHVCCSTIASLGLIRVWKQQTKNQLPADLSHAFPLFVIAIAVHGAYNFAAIFVGDLFSVGS